MGARWSSLPSPHPGWPFCLARRSCTVCVLMRASPYDWRVRSPSVWLTSHYCNLPEPPFCSP